MDGGARQLPHRAAGVGQAGDADADQEARAEQLAVVVLRLGAPRAAPPNISVGVGVFFCQRIKVKQYTPRQFTTMLMINL